MPSALSEFQRQVAAVLSDLEAHNQIFELDVRPAALGNPRLADMLFELRGEAMLVMVADHAPGSIRIVGLRREVEVALHDLEQTLLGWPRA